MDKIDELRLYDVILKFVKEHSLNGKVSSSGFSVLKMQLRASGITNDQFNNALEHLAGTDYLEERYLEYSLKPKGREKLLNSFESEYLETETYKALQLQNLTETTNLAVAQQEDIRRARLRSWWAIVISIFAFFLSVFGTFKEHFYKNENDGNNNKRVKSVIHKPIHDTSKKPLHDSIDK